MLPQIDNATKNHEAHWNLDRSSYNDLVWDSYISDEVFNSAHPGDVRTLETWATPVEILFAINRYRDMLNQSNYEYYFNNRQRLDRSSYNNPLWDGYISDEVFNSAHPGDVRNSGNLGNNC